MNSQFVETICIENGRPRNLAAHQRRMDRTVARFFPGQQTERLERLLAGCPAGGGLWKCRVVYGSEGIVGGPTYEPYVMRRVESLALVDGGDVEYAWKSTDRTVLNRLRDFRGDADEIIIVKDGLLTDTSYTNIALFDGRRWLTPARPLLCGTRREELLARGLIVEADIAAADIGRFEKVMLFNAMIAPGQMVVDTGRIGRL